ncbi:MAG: protein translocase subunit SecF [Halobacteriovoraceae bacterium]|nr:protein translocase subunit SecF [Halobacteriovoraceae bacterium]
MKNVNLNFVGKFPLAVPLSILMVVASIFLFFSKGLKYGVDFTGGAEIQITFEDTVKLGDLRAALNSSGFESSQVTSFGEIENHFLIKVSSSNEDLNTTTDKITAMLNESFADKGPRVDKTDIVGPKAGEHLRVSGFQAMAWALLMIMIYIALRFDYKYSPGAIVALVHDILIIIGVFVIFDREFSLQVVGALLAVIGYSVNDTVVVYDRVREQEEKSLGKSLKEQINIALNETLTRTLLTSLTTFIVAVVMYLMGGSGIENFFFVICLGVIIGTYSSIFVAAPTILLLDKMGKKA